MYLFPSTKRLILLIDFIYESVANELAGDDEVFFPVDTVPADGVKGKTWGPSTVHQKERVHIRPLVERTDGQQRQWSRSAPNLEKAQKNLLAAAAAAAAGQQTLPGSSTMPDLGETFFMKTPLSHLSRSI